MQYYLRGDPAEALKAAEEAADLGVMSAVSNVLHILEGPQGSLALCGVDKGSGNENCTFVLQKRLLHRHLQAAQVGLISSLHTVATTALAIAREEGLETLELAASAGYSRSAVELGWMHFTGSTGLSRNTSRAAAFFRQAWEAELLAPTFPERISHTDGWGPVLALAIVRLDGFLPSWIRSQGVAALRLAEDSSGLPSFVALVLLLSLCWMLFHCTERT